MSGFEMFFPGAAVFGVRLAFDALGKAGDHLAQLEEARVAAADYISENFAIPACPVCESLDFHALDISQNGKAARLFCISCGRGGWLSSTGDWRDREDGPFPRGIAVGALRTRLEQRLEAATAPAGAAADNAARVFREAEWTRLHDACEIAEAERVSKKGRALFLMLIGVMATIPAMLTLGGSHGYDSSSTGWAMMGALSIAAGFLWRSTLSDRGNHNDPQFVLKQALDTLAGDACPGVQTARQTAFDASMGSVQDDYGLGPSAL